MRKRKPRLEWNFIESNEAWERQQALLLPEVAPEIRRGRRLKRFLGETVLFLLLLMGCALWWRHSRQSALNKGEAEVRATVQLINQAGQRHSAQSVNTNAAHEKDWPFQLVENSAVTVQRVEILGDQAVVSVVISPQNGLAALRQRQFYRHTPAGWLPTAPDVTLWGTKVHLETPYFVYHFHEKDALTVRTIAPQMDTLAVTLRRNFGLPPVNEAAKLTVDVSIVHPPGQTRSWLEATDHVTITSPALYVAPVDLTDAELLAQSLAFPLVAYLLEQAKVAHSVDPFWLPLLDGIYLWQLWSLDLPLSRGRDTVVTWLYLGLPTSKPGQPVVLPPNYRELCTRHKLWMTSPLQMRIPMLCGERHWEDRYLSRWSANPPPTRLEQISMAASDLEGNEPDTSHPAQTVALALLIEYAQTTYGEQRLPALLATLGKVDRWETLLPAVFGVSVAEFEAGWQVYLAAQYGVSSITPPAFSRAATVPTS